jgi:hypothetical protein
MIQTPSLFLKTPLILFFVLVTAAPVVAQTFAGQTEFSISYGINTFQQTMHSTIIGGGSSYTEVTSATGTPFLTCRFYISNKFAIGITAGIQQFSTASYDDYFNGNPNIPYSTSVYNYRTMATEFLANYINKHLYRLYTYLGVGYSVFTERITQSSDVDQQTSFNMQYVPLGINIGNRLCGFAELGIGYKGFMNCGLSYRVGRTTHLSQPDVNARSNDYDY